jgi:hypothetical protein
MCCVCRITIQVVWCYCVCRPYCTVNMLQPIGYSNYCVYIHICLSTLLISPQFLILEMMAWSSDCFVKLCSLKMGE